ncbi:Cruciform DNA binding protein [Elasticomyces elasticus]|nr:Cruciform DNA binding protein [Elasticomyces elasticus]
MSSYTFRWDHPAEEVFVTGDFDNWAKTEKLEKSGSGHEKTVHFSKDHDKILYKFVADGNWSHDHTAKTETDHEGNVNNVLLFSDFTQHSANSSSAAPGSSTTAMAGQQPIEEREKSFPGAFPETPAPTSNDSQNFFASPLPASSGTGNPISLPAGEKVPDFNSKDIDSNVKLDEDSYNKSDANPAPTEVSNKEFGVNPLLASSGPSNPISLPAGEKVPDVDSKDIGSNVKLDEDSYNKSDANPAPAEDSKAFSVNPLPATGGISSPISLAPGEKVPDHSTITGNTAESNVHLDEASYNNSSASAPILPPVTSSNSDFGSKDIFAGLGPQTSNMIPESSMGMGKDASGALSDADVPTPQVSSVGPLSSTAQLAGAQPLEPRERNANISSVAPTSTTAEMAGAQPLEPRERDANISSVAPTSTTAQLAGSQPLEQQHSPPAIVTDSQKEAHVDPEASGSPRAVQEKDEFENELISKVPEAPAASEGTSTSDAKSPETGSSNKGIMGMAAGGLGAVGAAAAGYAYSARDKTTQATGKDPVSVLPQSVQDSINSMNTKGTTAPAAKSAEEPSSPVQHEPVNEASIPQQTHVGDGIEARGGSFGEKNAPGVPEEVVHSQKEAHVDPEASGSPIAVREKSEVEHELLSKIPSSEAQGEHAPTSPGGFSPDAQGEKTPSSDSGLGKALGMGAAGLGGAASLGAGAAALARRGKGQEEEAAPGVPQEVVDSQKEAHVGPEAASNTEAVQEKSQVEDELLSKIPTSTAMGEHAPKIAAGVAAGLGAGGIGAGVAAYSKYGQGQQPASGVPEPVVESQKEAHVDPEASASTEAVQEKSQVESELLSKIPTSTAMGEHAPKIAAGVAAGLGATGLGAGAAAAYSKYEGGQTAVSGVPEPVIESQKEAHVSPEAAAVPAAVQEKSAVENELLSKVPTSTASGEPAPEVASAAALTSTAPGSSSGAPQLGHPTAGMAALSMDDRPAPASSSGLNASAADPAVPQHSDSLAPPVEEEPVPSRDVSPMTKTATRASTATSTANQDAPVVTTGVASGSAPATQTAGQPVGTPRPNVTGAASNSTPQKRGSFMDRMHRTPDSTKSGASGAGKDNADGTPKKKGFFKRLAEKMKPFFTDTWWCCTCGPCSDPPEYAGLGGLNDGQLEEYVMSGGIHAGGNDRQPENSNPERHQPPIDKGKMQSVEEEEVAKENSDDDEQESPTNSFFKVLPPDTRPRSGLSHLLRPKRTHPALREPLPAVPDHEPADHHDSESPALASARGTGLSLQTSHDLNTPLPAVPTHEPGDLAASEQVSEDEEVHGHARRNAFGVGSLPDDLDEVHERAASEQGDGGLNAGAPIRSVHDTVNDLRATYSNSSGAPSTSLNHVSLDNTGCNEHDDAAPVPSARLRFAFVVDPPVGQIVQPQSDGSTVAQQPPSGDEPLPEIDDDGGVPPLEATIDDEGNIEVELDPAAVEVLERQQDGAAEGPPLPGGNTFVEIAGRPDLMPLALYTGNAPHAAELLSIQRTGSSRYRNGDVGPRQLMHPSRRGAGDQEQQARVAADEQDVQHGREEVPHPNNPIEAGPSATEQQLDLQADQPSSYADEPYSPTAQPGLQPQQRQSSMGSSRNFEAMCSDPEEAVDNTRRANTEQGELPRSPEYDSESRDDIAAINSPEAGPAQSQQAQRQPVGQAESSRTLSPGDEEEAERQNVPRETRLDSSANALTDASQQKVEDEPAPTIDFDAVAAFIEYR